MAREWTRAVNFGNVTLEEIIFSEDIKQEQLEARQKATEKLKAAIDAMNQKIKEQQAEEAEAKRLEAEEKEKARLAEEKRLKEEVEARLRAEA